MCLDANLLDDIPVMLHYDRPDLLGESRRVDLDTLSLDDIPPALVHEAVRVAGLRLHLYVLGEIHEKVTAVADVFAATTGGRALTPADVPSLHAALRLAWTQFIADYTHILGMGLRVAASIPFGMWAVLHNDWVRPLVDEPETVESYGQSPLFQPQLQEILDAIFRRTYGDGLHLSQRIWQLDRYGRDGLYNAINVAVARGDSAWDLAQTVERFLAPGRDCPRWTRQRLYGLTKADIAAGDVTGLLRGNACSGQGVSYNALRLARTEIQAALNMATTEIFRSLPFVEMEQLNLSPEHSHIDECDDLVTGGDKGDGVYPIGYVYLPVHPHCLCYKTAVLMDRDLFTDRLGGWMRGERPWADMDVYAQMMGGNLGRSLSDDGIGISLAYWLWGDHMSLGGLFWNMAMNL